MRMKDADHVQPAPGGFGLAAQHILRRDQIAVILLLRAPLIVQGQNIFHGLVPIGGAAQQQARPLVGVGRLAVRLERAQGLGMNAQHDQQ